MVDELWQWVRSWYWLHHLGFHDFGYTVRTVNYITYCFGDVMRQKQVEDHHPICSCGEVQARAS